MSYRRVVVRASRRRRLLMGAFAGVTLGAACAAVVQAAAPVSSVRPGAGPAGVAQAASGRSIHGRPVTVVTPRESCAALADLDLTGIPGAATQIDSATTASASGGWSYCDVTGTIAPQDQFELQLPLSTYTRRYLQVGCGVLCGTLSIVVPGAYSCLPVNDGEFAEASDDEGHTGGGGTFGENPELRADFGYITEHQLALVAKAIISHFYGSDPSYSYYDGCSNGGHEALSEAQRYPRDFNGIIAGASASIVQEANTFYQPWMANVDWTASGQPILTAGQLPLLHDAVMAACAGADGQIDDPLNCHYDPAALLCHGAPAPSCLTAAQVAVVKKIYSGPVDSQGQRLYPGGQPWGSELAWLGWVIPYPGQTYSQTLTYAIGSEWLKFLAFKRVLAGSQTAVLRHALFTAAEFAKAQKLAGLYDADNPDLSAFEADGGRLIMWQGWADEAVSPYGTIDYYTQMTRAMGGLTATQQFARLFMLPGVNHCVGGNAPNQIDAMDAIVNWVEQGPAPASLLATETSTSSPPTVVATRPIYPYPEISQYNGTGSVADASSYSGVPTTALPTTKWLGHFPSARALWCSYGSTGYLCTARRGGG